MGGVKEVTLKMSKIHMCPKCSKVLANRQSFSRHKKNCKGGRVLPFKHKDLLENEKKRLILHYTGFLEAVVHGGGGANSPLHHFFWSWCPKLALIQGLVPPSQVLNKKFWKRTFFGSCQHFR